MPACPARNTPAAVRPALTALKPLSLLPVPRVCPPHCSLPARLQKLVLETGYGTLAANSRRATDFYKVPREDLMSIGVDYAL